MNTSQQNEQLKEQISALVDDEHGAEALNLLMSTSNFEKLRKNWETYHQIGDVLNSDDLAIAMSAGFSTRMREQLASEPTYIKAKQKSSNRYDHKIIYATAAMLALATILVPRFAGHDGAEINAPYFAGQFMAASDGGQLRSAGVALTSSGKTVATEVDGNYAKAQPKMLRDPEIDSYLAAHQRYSTSMYSAVEYETGPISLETEQVAGQENSQEADK